MSGVEVTVRVTRARRGNAQPILVTARANESRYVSEISVALNELEIRSLIGDLRTALAALRRAEREQ